MEKDERRVSKKDKDNKVRVISNEDMLHIFLNGKIKPLVIATQLKITKNKSGSLVLWTREFSSQDYVKFAEYGKVNDQKIILLDPKVGSPRLISAIFGSISGVCVYWLKGFIPLSVEKALEIYNGQ